MQIFSKTTDFTWRLMIFRRIFKNSGIRGIRNEESVAHFEVMYQNYNQVPPDHKSVAEKFELGY